MRGALTGRTREGLVARDATNPSRGWSAIRPLGERVVKTYVNRTFVDQWVAPTRYERTSIVGGIADGPHPR